MAGQNINNYNFKRFKVRLDTSEYFDITLASDERDYDDEVIFSKKVIGIDDGNRLPINFDLTNTGTTTQPNLYWGLPNTGNTFTSTNYYNPNNEDLSCYTGFTGLCDAGLTMIDVGMFDKITGNTLYYSMGVFSGKTHDPLYHDRRMKLHPVGSFTNQPNHRFSGNTGETVYNIVNKTDSAVGYHQELYGGFFQGFYKLHGYDYEIFPERVNKGWTMETLIKPRQVDEYTLMDNQQYLNDVYPDNAGTFFFFGTRAENKFYHPASGMVETYNDFSCDFGVTISGATVEEYKRVTSGLTNCFKTCKCADTGVTSSNCFKIYPTTATTISRNNGLQCRGCDVKWTGETQDPRFDILSNGMSLRLSGDPKNPKLCVKYIKYTGDCVTTGTCETTGLTYSSGYCINEICSTAGIYDVCGYPISESERTLERWVMLSAVFERYKYLEDCDLLNVGGLGDIRKEVYTATTYGVSTNLIQPGGLNDLKVSEIQWTQKWLNQVDDRRGVLRLYVNGYLFMVIEDFEEIIPHELNTEKEKQIGVPYTISWGGGTQGLRESLIPSGCTAFDGPYIQDPECMPNETLSATSMNELQTNIEMEPAFGGTFMGGISKMRFYTEPLSSPQVQHNFRIERDVYNLFDFWCPNCLEILTQCYFDFNVDLESCDFDFIANDIACSFGFNVVDIDCEAYFNVLPASPSPTPTKSLTPTQTPTITSSVTPTDTPSSTQTPTPTQTPTLTQTPTYTSTPTGTPGLTPTQTPTVTQTNTPEQTHTPTLTQTQTLTSTPTFTTTQTPTQTLTNTPTVTKTLTNTPTVTQTLTPSVTSSITPTNTITPTVTQTLTPSPTQAVVPSDPTLEIYYQSDLDSYFTPTPTSGDSFNQWVDSSASAHNANPIGGGAGPSPEWWDNQLNGLGGVYFNGTTDGLSVNPLTDLQSISGETIILVAKSLNSSSTGQYLQGGQDGNTGIFDAFLRQSGGTYDIAIGGGRATGGTVDTSPHILSIVFSGGASSDSDKLKFRIDSSGQTLSFTNSPNTTTSSLVNYLFMGVSYTSVPAGVEQYFYNGLLFDILIYSRALSNTELQDVENYLANKWGL